MPFDVSELRFRRSLPYLAIAFGCIWLSILKWQVLLLVPGAVFLGLGAAAWSAMRDGAFKSGGGRLASKERLLDMLPQRAEDGCPKAQNLITYRKVAPFFWGVYGWVCLVLVLRALPPL